MIPRHLPFSLLVLCAIATVCLAADAPTPAVPALPLAASGKALQSVVISDHASKNTRQVADELAHYLGQMAGATFEVKPGDGTQGIVLGTLAEFLHPELAAGLTVRNVYDGREAYAIRTEPKRLLLIGAADLGVSHAAFRLLESLGCRWLFPAKEWEVVPSKPTLSIALTAGCEKGTGSEPLQTSPRATRPGEVPVPFSESLNETDRPAILARRIWWGYGFFDYDRGVKDYQAWARHNRMASSFTVSCGHAWQSIIAANQKLFDAHPEYLALTGGKRQGPQFCVSNAEVRKLALQYALDHFRRQPQTDMVSLETSDGSGHCECDACRRLGSISDRLFGLANEVAREVARRCPGKMIGLYAYNDHCEPPSFALEPNVYVQSTAGFIRGRYTFDELMELWPKRCRNMGFYDYLSVWLWDFDMPPGGRGANLKYIRQQIPRYVACGATSIDCESGNNWGVHGLGYYVANRLMWNPKTDVDALLADFFQQAFGLGAEPMRRYYQRLDPGNEPILSAHLLALALRDLAEAAKLAQARPDVQARLDQLKQYQHYVRLRWEHDRTADKDRRRDMVLAILTHVYRTRWSYMNHWEAMRNQWISDLSKQYGRTGWGSRDPWQGAWKVETPCSHDETERLFQDDLTYFQPEPIEEKTFSADLVPGGFKSDKPAATNQRFQGGARYAFFSPHGEPLELTITTGIIAWYRDRPEAAYTFSDGAGKPIAQGRLTQDGREHPLSIKVPQPGLYWLEFNDQAAGWGIAVPAGRPVCLALRRGGSAAHMGHMQRMYFYVPAGVRQIQYYWDGGPHEVFAPDGKLAASIATRGRFVTVAVPPGADNRVWSLGKLCLGRLWFFNVPNYLAASPDALLVPLEGR